LAIDNDARNAEACVLNLLAVTGDEISAYIRETLEILGGVGSTANEFEAAVVQPEKSQQGFGSTYIARKNQSRHRFVLG
jgi:hypothetical protein